MLPATGSGDFSPLLQTELVLDLATQKGCKAELTWVVVSWVSHNTTCHPAVVTFPPLPQMSLVLDLATPVGCKAELTWGCDQLYVDLVCGCVQWFVKSAALAVWSIETGDKPSAGSQSSSPGWAIHRTQSISHGGYQLSYCWSCWSNLGLLSARRECLDVN